MPSTFAERFREVAVPRLVEKFAERDQESGEFITLKYWPDGKTELEPLEFPGIKSRITNELQFTIDGEVRQETRTWRIERTLLDARGIAHPQRNGIAEDAEGRWSVDVGQCIWDEVFVTLALVRSPRVTGNELRSAAV